MKTIWIKQGYYKYASVYDDLEIADFTVTNLNELLDIFF